jgi:hypothetical protein
MHYSYRGNDETPRPARKARAVCSPVGAGGKGGMIMNDSLERDLLALALGLATSKHGSMTAFIYRLLASHFGVVTSSG